MISRSLAILMSILLFAEASGQQPLLTARGAGVSLFQLGSPAQSLYEPQNTSSGGRILATRFGHSIAPEFVSPPPRPANALTTSAGLVASCDPAGCGNNVCETNSCQPCCCSPCDETGRRYAVDVGVSLFGRSRPDSDVLFVNPSSPSENVNASSLQPNATAAIESGVILYEQHHLTDLEFRATWADGWTSHATQTFSGTTVQFNADPAIGTTGPRDGTIVYATDFFSTEVNLRFRSSKKCAGPTWILGARVILLDELLAGKFADANGVFPNEDVVISTRNQLVGVHFGADRVLKNCPRWCVKWSWRAGLYGNEGQQNSRLISQASPPISFPARGGGGNVAWHAEGGVSAKWRLSKCTNAFLSYRLMYLDGLALATDQLSATDFLSQRGFDDDGALLLQSATLGFELAF